MSYFLGLPDGAKPRTCPCRKHKDVGLIAKSGKSWRGTCNQLQCIPGKYRGQESLAGYSHRVIQSWTQLKQLSTHHSISRVRVCHQKSADGLLDTFPTHLVQLYWGPCHISKVPQSGPCLNISSEVRTICFTFHQEGYGKSILMDPPEISVS